jgi:hypothetical protein
MYPDGRLWACGGSSLSGTVNRKIPGVAQRFLYVLESWPRIGLFLTRKKFFLLIKGEP